METSIVLGRVISKIESIGTYSTVSNHKIGDLAALISSVNTFDFSGCVPVKKFERAEKEIAAAGFRAVRVSHRNECFETGVSFRITYARA